MHFQILLLISVTTVQRNWNSSMQEWKARDCQVTYLLIILPCSTPTTWWLPFFIISSRNTGPGNVGRHIPLIDGGGVFHLADYGVLWLQPPGRWKITSNQCPTTLPVPCPVGVMIRQFSVCRAVSPPPTDQPMDGGSYFDKWQYC